MFKSICITGVDGTGKSTMVKKVKLLFDDNTAVIQYMGMKDFETARAQDYFERHRSIPLGRFALINEMWYRVYKHRKKDKIVIFDRYTDEHYLEYVDRSFSFKNLILKYLYKMFFVYLQYRPTVYIYLTCDFETSLRRKNDIITSEEKEALKHNKLKLDRYYKNKKGVFIIDTTNQSIDESIGIIKNYLEGMMCFSTLMN